MRQTLIVMVKEPRAGRVKTRLGRDIGMVPAAWWFRHHARDLIRRLRDPRWRIVLSVSPDVQGLNSRFWPGDLARLPQGRGDIGQRMIRALQGIPLGRVCLVGADIFDLRRQHVSRAFAALGGHDIVFGPTEDGGFWLVGVHGGRALPRGLFQNVRWSGPDTLGDAILSMTQGRVGLVDRLQDVDRATDLAGRRAK